MIYVGKYILEKSWSVPISKQNTVLFDLKLIYDSNRFIIFSTPMKNCGMGMSMIMALKLLIFQTFKISIADECINYYYCRIWIIIC